MSDSGPAPRSGYTALARQPFLVHLLDLPATTTKLDPVAAKARDVVQALLPQKVADVLNGTWLGHPLHPISVYATVGTWSSAAVLDAAALTGLVPAALEDGVEASSAALVGVGLASTASSTITGWSQYADLHEDQQRIAIVHASANYVATGLMAVSLWARLRGRRTTGRLVSIAAVAVNSVGASLGSHLAYRWAAGANHAEHVAHVAPSGWYRVGTITDLAEGTPSRASVGEVPVVLVREGLRVHVLADSCTHLAGPLSEGEVISEGGRACIVCPWHGSTFRLEDGVVVHGPASAPQPTFEVDVTAAGDVLARVRELPDVPASPPRREAVAR